MKREKHIEKQSDARTQQARNAARVRWARQLAREVAEIAGENPELDPEDIRHTLICLKLTPAERLNRSLRRGRGFAALRR